MMGGLPLIIPNDLKLWPRNKIRHFRDIKQLIDTHPTSLAKLSSYLRVMMGGLPLIITDDKEALAKKQKEDEEKELELANEKARRERGDYEYKG